MAGSDYLRCEIPECNRKVYYDGDVDWRDREQFPERHGHASFPVVLCGEHNKTHRIAALPREAP